MVLLKSGEKLEQGDKAPHFVLKNVDGNKVNSEQFKGKIMVVIFMCNHCPYVKPKMKEIAQIQNDYRSKDVVVVCINSNDPNYDPEDDFEHMQEAAKQFGYDYYLVDDTQQTAKAYGAVCTPDPFIFDKEHKLIYHGRIDNAMNPNDIPTQNDMRIVLNKMLKGEKVEEWFVPSMGCSIKWK